MLGLKQFDICLSRVTPKVDTIKMLRHGTGKETGNIREQNFLNLQNINAVPGFPITFLHARL